MKDVLQRILIGVCGGVAFAFINELTISLTGLGWWLAFSVVFIVFFIAAVVIDRYFSERSGVKGRHVVGSRNISNANQEIDIQLVADQSDGEREIGSRNVSKRDQNISIGRNNR